jgi:hypothetical protein
VTRERALALTIIWARAYIESGEALGPCAVDATNRACWRRAHDTLAWAVEQLAKGDKQGEQ